MSLKMNLIRLLKNTGIRSDSSIFYTITQLASQYIESMRLNKQFGMPDYIYTKLTDEFCLNLNRLVGYKVITKYSLTPKSVKFFVSDSSNTIVWRFL